MNLRLNKNGTRFKLTMYSFILFVILGMTAYIIHPHKLNEFGAYLAVTSLPILTYIISRSFRGQTAKIAIEGTRYKVALFAFHVYIILGSIAYFFEPEYISQMTGYAAAISVPILSYIVGRTIRGAKDFSDGVNYEEKS